MKISLNLLSKFNLDVKEYIIDPQKLNDLLTNAGLEVEGISNQAAQFNHVVVGKILEKNKHPGADQLTLCLVDTGDKQQKIVCGAKNHHAGDKVVVALPGAVLPGNFAIKISKIRGEESSGMLCSEKELGLKSESEGIVILPENAPVGESFAKYFKLDDVIFDIKVTPNRSDCLSHIGIAREISALTGKTYEAGNIVLNEGKDSTKKLVKVSVEDTERCPRYAGRLVKNIKVKPSPEWLKKALEALGLRSINNVVDTTNYIMMMYGQPLHAFDVAKLKGAQIVVRVARAGEKFKTLDEKDLTLKGSELVIADGESVVALAGVMGGFDSGVSDSTTDVFIEAAIFNSASVRRAAKLHGMDTDASYRFARGVDPEGVVNALNRCCQILSEVAEGSSCIDPYDIYPRPVSRPRIELDLKFIGARLGFNIESIETKKILERIGCIVSGSGDKLLVNPPPFRPDLKLAEDLGEEILRFKGFSYIPENMPMMTAEPTRDDKNFVLEKRLSLLMIAEGYSQAANLSLFSSEFENKVLTQTDEKDLGFNLNGPSVKIANPLNIDLNVMRRAIFPSLFKNILHNTRHGNLSGKLFEIGTVFSKTETPDIKDQKKPFYEELHLSIVQWGERSPSWIKSDVPGFYELKGALENFFSTWNYKTVKFQPFKNAPLFLHPGQSSQINVEGKNVGFMGVIHPGLSDSLGIKVPVYFAELNLKTLFANQPRSIKSKEVPKFPLMTRDVALLVPDGTLASDVKLELMKAAGQLAISCDIFDLYSGKNLPPDTRSIAMRLTYQDPQKTMLDEEINALHQKAVKAVCTKLNLSVR